MNQDKAREFFSAYFEGSLESGLKQAFEARLQADTQLQREYKAFETTMAQLDSLKFESIEVPQYLSDRIATRLEAVADSKAKSKAPWFGWVKGLSFAALAGVAIIGTVLSINHVSSGAAQAGPIAAASHPVPTVEVKGTEVVLKFKPDTAQQIVVSSDGKELKRFDLRKDEVVQSPLRNSQPETALFGVKVQGSKDLLEVAVPGTAIDKSVSGQGTLEQFATSLAGHYKTVVSLQVSDPTQSVRWSFDGTDVYDAADNVLKPLGNLSVMKMEGGFVQIVSR